MWPPTEAWEQPPTGSSFSHRSSLRRISRQARSARRWPGFAVTSQLGNSSQRSGRELRVSDLSRRAMPLKLPIRHNLQADLQGHRLHRNPLGLPGTLRAGDRQCSQQPAHHDLRHHQRVPLWHPRHLAYRDGRCSASAALQHAARARTVPWCATLRWPDAQVEVLHRVRPGALPFSALHL